MSKHISPEYYIQIDIYFKRFMSKHISPEYYIQIDIHSTEQNKGHAISFPLHTGITLKLLDVI